MNLPASLREAVAREAEGLSGRPLGAAGRRLSRHYREGGTSRAADPAAYLAARLPGTYAAAFDALEEVRRRLPSFAPTSLLDVGSGPGTAAWAAFESLPTISKVTLLDASASMQALSRRLTVFAPWEALRDATHAPLDLTSAAPLPAADLVTAAYALGEVPKRMLSGVVDRLTRAAGRLLLVVEPGTPAGYRRLLAVRWQVLGRGWHVAAPCPHDADCPLVGGDWCHFPARYQRTAEEIRARAGTRPFADEKYSYVALTPEPVGAFGARVIDRPRRGNGHIGVRLCTKGGLVDERASRRDPEAYRRLRQAAWGTWLPDREGSPGAWRPDHA